MNLEKVDFSQDFSIFCQQLKILEEECDDEKIAAVLRDPDAPILAKKEILQKWIPKKRKLQANNSLLMAVMELMRKRNTFMCCLPAFIAFTTSLNDEIIRTIWHHRVKLRKLFGMFEGEMVSNAQNALESLRHYENEKNSMK